MIVFLHHYNYTLAIHIIYNYQVNKILLLYNSSIYETADVISTNVQRMGIENMQYGYATAVGLFNSVVGSTLLVISNTLSKKATDIGIV